MSTSGRVVAFSSSASLTPADGDDLSDVYLRDIASSTTTLVSRATGAAGAKGDSHSGGAALSGDGRRVAFISSATNLSADDVDPALEVYVRDTVANTTTLLSRANGANGAGGNGPSDRATISADGRVVAFDSRATNLSIADPVPDHDQYVRVGSRRPAASTPHERKPRAPVRRWYRVSAEVTLRNAGDFTFPTHTDHREINVVLRLRSRTAIVLFHQCIPLATPKRVDPKSLAKFLALGRTAFSCAEVEHKLREGGLTTRC